MLVTIVCIIIRVATALSRHFADTCQTSNAGKWHSYRELVRPSFGVLSNHSWKQHGAAWLQKYEQEPVQAVPPKECPEGVLFYRLYALALGENVTLDKFPECFFSTSKHGRLACAVNVLLTNQKFRNLDILALTKSAWPLFGLIHQVVAHAPRHKRNIFPSSLTAEKISALLHYESGGGPRAMLRESSPIELALNKMSAELLLDVFDHGAIEGDATFIPPSLHASLQKMPTLGRCADALTTPQSALPLLLHMAQFQYLYRSSCPPGTHLVAAKGAVSFRVCVRDKLIGSDAAMSFHGNWDTCEYLLRLYRELIGLLPSESPMQAKPCLIVDIGCHIGVCVLHFAVRGCRVIAVDTGKDNIQMLNTSAWLNGLEKRVTPVLAAVSNTTGGDVLVSDGADSSSQNTRICKTGETQVALCSTGSSVPIWRIDDLLGSLGLHASDVSMLKIDTEGHDINVLRGAEQILACRPKQAGPVVAFEMHPDFRDDWDELHKFFVTRGYDVMPGKTALSHAARSIDKCSEPPPAASYPYSTTSTSTTSKTTTSTSPSTFPGTAPNLQLAIDCEWMQLLLHPNTSLFKVGERVVHDHLVRMSVWASQTAPELLGMREAYPVVSEDAVKSAAMDVVCRRCKPFMPVEPVGDLRNRLVRGMAECVREHEKGVLSNLTARKAIDGMPGPRTPCRDSVISGDLLLQMNGLMLDADEIGPHQKSMECAAEIALVPALHLPPLFSSVRDLRKACTVFLHPGMMQWQPWCRGIQHLFKEKRGYTSSNEAWWMQQLVQAGLLESGAADGGVVQPSSLSLDQEDVAYLGLFRIRNASIHGDSVVMCDCDWPWPECHSRCPNNRWYGSAWHDPTVDGHWIQHRLGETRRPSDATYICCNKALETGWFTVAQGCRKSALSQTCPLLTGAERKGKFVNLYETCLQRLLQPTVNMSSSAAWLSMVSKSVDRCCRDDRARAQSLRIMQEIRSHKLCSHEDECGKHPMLDRLFHTWHPWDSRYFHLLFENIPTILAFREYLADNADINIRVGDKSDILSDKLLGKASEVLHEFRLPLTRMIEGGVFYAKELLIARIMPATSLLMPPAQLLVPNRAVLCTASLADTAAGQHESYGSTVWELAIGYPRECEKFGHKGCNQLGKCYTTGVVHSPQDHGALRILIAEHGGASSGPSNSRCWTSAKRIVHEAVEQLESLLPAELLPRAVIVADVVIGDFPSDFQRRSFSEAHIVIGGMGSQLANAALCMQPGSYLGVIQWIGHSDAFLWNQASAFGVQYWTLISSNPGHRNDRYSALGFSTNDEKSLKVFMERALVGTAAMLVSSSPAHSCHAYTNLPQHLEGLSNCPRDEHWLQSMAKADPELTHKAFMVVGCNTGVDAVRFLQMWGNTRGVMGKWKRELLARVGDGVGVCSQNALVSSDDDPVLLSSPPNPKVFCIEPGPSIVQVLQNTSNAVFGSTSSFTVLPFAASDREGTALFPDVDAGDWFNEIGQIKQTHEATEPELAKYADVQVRIATVDQMALENNVTGLDGLVIDAECYDPAVLAGATNTLHTVRYLVFEVSQYDPAKISCKPGTPSARVALHSQVDKAECRIGGMAFACSQSQGVEIARLRFCRLRVACVRHVEMLNTLNFDCYWAGNNAKVQRLTGCWNSELEKQWSPLVWTNVVCVKRGDVWHAIFNELDVGIGK